jgi:hypothetical protein
MKNQNITEAELRTQQQKILLEQQKIFTKEQNDIQKSAYLEQRLAVLNLKKDPKNPERKGLIPNGQSVVNGINAVPGLRTVAALVDYAAGGVANSAKKIANIFKKDQYEIKPNDFGDWDARKEDMEKQTAILEPLQKDGKLLKEIENKCKDKNGNLDKAEFAKSAVNILSRDDNKYLLEKYLDRKGFSEKEIKKAITDVNEAKHILLTGNSYENFKSTPAKPEEKNKELIEFLGYKTKGEINLMSSAEIAKTMGVLKEDFGFTLTNDGKIEHKEPNPKSENYQKELKTANNINESSKDGEGNGGLDYSKQNGELEEQKAKEKAEKAANNQNYSRTSAGETPQSGMSAGNMAGNAAVLGGAIAAAVALPFVGWIVALAILYCFKDKFKDDPKANEEFENAARSSGLKDEELNKLKKELKQYEEGNHKNQQQVGDAIKGLYTNGVDKVLNNAQQKSQEIQNKLPNIVDNNQENVVFDKDDKNNTRQDVGVGKVNTLIYQSKDPNQRQQ